MAKAKRSKVTQESIPKSGKSRYKWSRCYKAISKSWKNRKLRSEEGATSWFENRNTQQRGDLKDNHGRQVKLQDMVRTKNREVLKPWLLEVTKHRLQFEGIKLWDWWYNVHKWKNDKQISRANNERGRKRCQVVESQKLLAYHKHTKGTRALCGTDAEVTISSKNIQGIKDTLYVWHFSRERDWSVHSQY